MKAGKRERGGEAIQTEGAAKEGQGRSKGGGKVDEKARISWIRNVSKAEIKKEKMR